MQKNTITLFLIMGAAFLAGCIGTALQTLPPVEFECRVIEYPSMKPISGATAVWRYVGPSGESQESHPFLSDADGIIRVSVPELHLPVRRMDAYFAGGYFREIRISAPGFDPGTWDELQMRDWVDRSTIRPVEFRLVRKEQKPAPTPVSPTPAATP